MSTTLITGGTVVRSSGETQEDILIEDHHIVELTSRKAESGKRKADEVIDASGKLILSALIDPHVHCREPGFPEKATLASEAAAARNGGIQTICDMPNTSPPTTTVEAFQDKVSRAEKISDCDIRFYFGLTEMEHLKELEKLFTSPDLEHLKERCCGVKLYLDHSTGNQKAEMDVIEGAFELCSKLGIVVVAHCEDPEMNDEARSAIPDDADISRHSEARPPESEGKAIANAIELAKKYGTSFHVAHLSTLQGLEHVRKAKADGLSITCEVTPHHLFLSVDEYDWLGTLGKMNPPLRTREHLDALWQGVFDGTVDCIATDHAPHTLEEKQAGLPLLAPSGVPGLETTLALLLTAVANSRSDEELHVAGSKLQVTDIVRLCFENPNKIFSLGKFGIEKEAEANLLIIDAQKEWVITGEEMKGKCKWTPFEGWEITGKIEIFVT